MSGKYYFQLLFIGICATNLTLVASNEISDYSPTNLLLEPEKSNGTEFIPVGSVTTNGTTKTFYGEIEAFGDSIFYLSWIETILFCEEHNMSIARVESFEETSLLGNFLADTFDGSHFWLGGTDLNNHGNWYWIGGGPIESFFWHDGEPWGHPDHCLSVYEDGTWKALDCSDTRRPLCQMLS